MSNATTTTAAATEVAYLIEGRHEGRVWSRDLTRRQAKARAKLDIDDCTCLTANVGPHEVWLTGDKLTIQDGLAGCVRLQWITNAEPDDFFAAVDLLLEGLSPTEAINQIAG